jgi:hypothetical protein
MSVNKRYYNAESTRRLLAFFEDRWGMRSEDFYDAHVADAEFPRMPGFHRHVWASLYRDYRRLGGRTFSDHAGQTLA